MKNNIKMLRSKLNITQTDLSTKVGVSRISILNIESDKHEPKIGLAYKIAKVLGSEVSDVFYEGKNPLNKND